MKKLLLSSLSIFAVIGAFAQWGSQATGFSTVSRGVFDVSAVDANVVWICTYDGSGGGGNSQDFSRTTDGGQTWIPGVVSAPSNYQFSNIWGIDANTAWAIFYDAGAGTGGGIFKTTDGGTTWNQQGVGSIYDANSFPNVVYFANSNIGWSMGDPNGGYFELYNTIDGGNTWTRVPQANIPAPLAGEYGYTNGFDVVGTNIWFMTNMGRVYKSSDAGLNWTVATTPFSNVSDIVMLDASNGMITNAGAIATTSDGGATWNQVSISSGIYYEADLENIPNSVTYVSTGAQPGGLGSGSSYSTDGGMTWNLIDSAIQHTAQGWVDGSTGWCGGFNTSASADGIFKYVGATLGINSLDNDLTNVQVFPNPSEGAFNLNIKGGEAADALIRINDLMGSLIFEEKVSYNGTLMQKYIDLGDVSPGVYFVNVENGTKRFVSKLIVR